MQKHQVKALLMGGQACVWFGAAEFSRDTDLAVLVEPENIRRLTQALGELQAECIAVPPFETAYLDRGHAIHFRCHHPEAERLRVDIMSRMRGVDPFEDLWIRREILSDDAGNVYNLLSLPDLVSAKKTQREKDWPMIRRLLEADYEQHRSEHTLAQIEFWFRELRSPEILIRLASEFPHICRRSAEKRPLLEAAMAGNEPAVAQGLFAEMTAEMEADRAYWAPLKREISELRKAHRHSQ